MKNEIKKCLIKNFFNNHTCKCHALRIKISLKVFNFFQTSINLVCKLNFSKSSPESHLYFIQKF